MKKNLLICLVAAMCVLALSACGGQANNASSSAADSASSAAIEVTVEDGQNPLMNFVGPYACERAQVIIEAEGLEGAKATVTWGSSAAESTVWVMEGTFDGDTLTMTYDKCTKTNLVLKENGDAESEEVVYEDGTGTIVFTDGNPLTLVWNDEKEHAADDMVFTWAA